MVNNIEQRLRKIASCFCIEGDFISYEQIKEGNVNQTYKVTYKKNDGTLKSYIIQQINTYAFHNPEELMSNIDKVCGFIRSKNPNRLSLHFYHTCDRKTYIADDIGYWRICNHIDSTTYNECPSPAILENAAKAFGDFQEQLCDFDASVLFETIPDFHNTRKRISDLKEASKNDIAKRASLVKEELDYIFSVEDEACTLTDMLNNEELPLRVTHNDTKINNVLFDKLTNEALVIVDLDTVMPGLVGSDFGDAVRFACNTVAEDSEDFENAHINLETFEIFTKGFLEKTKNSLTENEIKTLPISVFAITVELASRFLTDYLNGDKYFKTNYENHNLVRTKCQLALAKDIYKNLDTMKEIVNKNL